MPGRIQKRIRAVLIAAAMAYVESPLAERSDPDLLYGCDARTSRVELVEPGFADPQWENDMRARGYEVEPIASYKLIQHASASRDGSKTLKRKCGVLTVTVRGGYLNDNATGELGELTFPLVSIFLNGKVVAGDLAFGECDATLDRYSHAAQCPDSWVTEATAFPDSKNSALLFLRHSYRDSRKAP